MNGILLIVRTAFRSLGKTPSVPFLWLALPLALAAVFYFAFGQTADEGSTGPPRGTLLVTDHDESLVSGLFTSALSHEPLSNFFITKTLADTAKIRASFEELEAAAALVIPAGFQDSVLTGAPADLRFARNPRMSFNPQMTAVSLQTFLDIANRLLNELEPAFSEIQKVQHEPFTRASFMKISETFYDVGQNLGNGFAVLTNLERLDVAVRRPGTEKAESFTSSTDFFAAFLPGLLLFGLLFVGDGFERRFLRERHGVLLRAATAPIHRVQILFAQAVVVLLGTLVCAGLVLGLGALLFRVKLHGPAPLFLTVLGFSLFITGLFKTMYARARSEGAAAAVSTVVILVMSLLGGGFVPVEIFPPALQTVSALTPFGGASRGMVDILLKDHGFAQVAPDIVRTWLWGLGFCLVGFVLAGRSQRHA